MPTANYNADYMVIKKVFDIKQLNEFSSALNGLYKQDTVEAIDAFEKSLPEYICPLDDYKITLSDGGKHQEENPDADFSKLMFIPYDITECEEVLEIVRLFQIFVLKNKINAGFSSIEKAMLDNKKSLEEVEAKLQKDPNDDFDKTSLNIYKRRIIYLQNLSRFYTAFGNHYTEIIKAFLIFIKWSRTIYMNYYKNAAEIHDKYIGDKIDDVEAKATK